MEEEGSGMGVGEGREMGDTGEIGGGDGGRRAGGEEEISGK